MFTAHPKSSYKYDENTKELTASATTQYEPHPGGLGKFYFDNLKRWAQKDKILQIDTATDEKDSAKDLLTRSIKTALYMKSQGIQPGDIISTCSFQHINASVPIIAAQMIGAIVSSTDPIFSLDHTKYILDLIKPKMFFVGEGSENVIQQAVDDLNIDGKIIAFHSHPELEQFHDVLEKYSEEDVNGFVPYEAPDLDATSVIMFSSGTTGKPKGICLSHNYFLYTAGKGDASEFNLNMFGYTSYYWVGTMHVLNISIAVCITLVWGRNFDPDEYWAILDKYQIMFTRVSPVLHLESIKGWKEGNGKSVRGLALVGLNLNKEDFENASSFYPNSQTSTMYALTETGLVTTFRTGDANGSVGTLDLNDQIIRIVDPETEKALGLNATGEIRIKRKYQMNGYYKVDSADCWDSEGFFKTGDLGYLDDDFNLFVIDRIKEVFLYRGFQVIPGKIEEVLMQHPNVRHAVAIGAPHRVDNWHVMGIVVLKDVTDKSSADAIEEFANARLDNINKIRAGIRILTMEDIPKTPSGKINRKELRDLYGNVYN